VGERDGVGFGGVLVTGLTEELRDGLGCGDGVGGTSVTLNNTNIPKIALLGARMDGPVSEIVSLSFRINHKPNCRIISFVAKSKIFAVVGTEAARVGRPGVM